MLTDANEIKRREKSARTAIKCVFGQRGDNDCVTLVVSHHLEEIDETYWEKYLNTDCPEPSQVLDILELDSHWEDNENADVGTPDFTLPGDITNYVISVRFSDTGEIKEILMES